MRLGAGLLALALVAGCSSSSGSSANEPNLQVHLTQVGSGNNNEVFYMRGPIAIQYVLSVANPTSQQYTLRRLDIRSVGPGAYYIRTGATPITKVIPPGGTTNISLQAWGTARGGRLTADEPVDIRGVVYFDGPTRPFQKVFTEVLSQF